MPYEIEIKDQPAQPVLVMRTVTSMEKLPQFLGLAYGGILQYLEGLKEPPGGMPFAKYYNLDMAALDVEGGWPVMLPLPGSGEILASEIPAGRYASMLYTGPYQDCGPAYEAMGAWIAQNGYEATGIAYEFYLNSPQDVPPSQLQMQIVFPLKD